MFGFSISAMKPADWDEVATLVYESTNGWYQANLNRNIFLDGPASTRLFCSVYEALDPGCCLIARADQSGSIIGSCFYHPRETHYSLGIMNVHPDALGRGVAKTLLADIIERANKAGLPIRLVSSTMNLDSYSLYTRAGFVPRQTYQDMIIDIPAAGIAGSHPLLKNVRDAQPSDVSEMKGVELSVANISREKDYRYFIDNELGVWHTSVLIDQNDNDRMRGWIVSIADPASCMIGPCIAEDQDVAIALLLNELNYRRGQTMVFLAPVECDRIVAAAYGWGARNCEMHVAQVYGDFKPFNGVAMPTFMPETG